MNEQEQEFNRVVVDLATRGIREDFSSIIARAIKFEYAWTHTTISHVLKHRYINHCYDLLMDD